MHWLIYYEIYYTNLLIELLFGKKIEICVIFVLNVFFFSCLSEFSISTSLCVDPEGEGGQGVRTHPEKSQIDRLLGNTGPPDPLKITKLPSQNLVLGHHQPAFSGLN